MQRQRPRPLLAMAVFVAFYGCSISDESSESSSAAPELTPSASEGTAETPTASPQERIFRVLMAEFDRESKSVKGQWGTVRFEASLAADGQATARFWSVFDSGELASKIMSPTEGQVSWADSTIDGKGTLSEAEATALIALENSGLAEALARIPLDLSCREGGQEVDPALGAALILPWQLLVKYGSPAVLGSVRGHADRSPCEHFRSPLRAWDPRRTPSPTLVALSFEQPLPTAVGYFPLSSKGAGQ